MPRDATQLQDDGSVVMQDDGSVGLIDPSGGCDCCDGVGQCAEYELVEHVLRNGASHATWDPPSGSLGVPGVSGFYWYTQPRCWRLFVWERRPVVAGVYGGNQQHDWIVKTLRNGPNAPIETTKGSGVLLDYEPYFWGCVGGYELVPSMHYEPTLAEVQANMVGPSIDGTYTLVAVVRYNSWKRNQSGPNPGEVMIPPEDGQVKLWRVVHVIH